MLMLYLRLNLTHHTSILTPALSPRRFLLSDQFRIFHLCAKARARQPDISTLHLPYLSHLLGFGQETFIVTCFESLDGG